MRFRLFMSTVSLMLLVLLIGTPGALAQTQGLADRGSSWEERPAIGLPGDDSDDDEGIDCPPNDLGIAIRAADVPFTIAIGGSSGAAVLIAQSSTNVIVRNARLSGGAVGVQHPAGSTLADITIENVDVENTDQAGIQLRSVSQVEIVSCRVETVANGPGISVLNSSNVEFTGRLVNNTVHDVGGNGIELFNLRGGILKGNVVSRFSMTG